MENKIFESLSDVIIVADGKGKIVDVTDSVEDVFLYRREELIGEDLTILMPKESWGRHKGHFQSFKKHSAARRMGTGKSLVAVDKSGSEFDVDIALSSYEMDGTPYYAAIIRDISDIKEIERVLEKNNHELQVINKELENFAFIVSHDLKTPARTVKQLIQFIKEDHHAELSGKALEYFSKIQERVEGMTDLIDGILNYSRAGRTYVKSTEFNLGELFKEIYSSLTIPDKFKLEFPETSEMIYGSRLQLGQVLTNLIDNAIKYHEKEMGRIEVKFKKRLGFYEFLVKDNGPGIKEEDYETIFEMFGTAHGTNRSDSTGIGLAIVKKIIEKNGGGIKVKSTLGEGTKFIFSWKMESFHKDLAN